MKLRMKLPPWPTFVMPPGESQPSSADDATDIYAFLALHPNGGIGVCGMKGPVGWMPMVTTQYSNLEGMRPLAAQVAKDLKIRIILRKYSNAMDFETFDP